MVDFKIKNSLDATRTVTKVGTVGSGPDLDLSTGSYFKHSVGNATTFSFSNPPETGKALSFTLELSATSGQRFNFKNYLPDGLSGELDRSYTALKVSPDNTKLFALYEQTVNTDYRISTFTMTTPGDINTLTLSSNSPRIGYDTTKDFSFSDDGSRFFIMGNNGFLYWKDTTTDFTPIAATGSNGTDFGNTNNTHFHLGDSGTRLYITDDNTETIKQYSLSTAWDTKTATYIQDSPIVDGNGLYSPVNIGPISNLSFNSEGSAFYIRLASASNSYDTVVIRKFQMSTAWDVSTATHVEDNFVAFTSDNITTSGRFTFNSDGSKMYMFSSDSLTVGDRFITIPTEDPFAVTWPSNVKWTEGLPGTAPTTGNKKLYSFFTVDGGTTYFAADSGWS